LKFSSEKEKKFNVFTMKNIFATYKRAEYKCVGNDPASGKAGTVVCQAFSELVRKNIQPSPKRETNFFRLLLNIMVHHF